MKEEKGFKEYKNGSKGKNLGQAKENPGGGEIFSTRPDRPWGIHENIRITGLRDKCDLKNTKQESYWLNCTFGTTPHRLRNSSRQNDLCTVNLNGLTRKLGSCKYRQRKRPSVVVRMNFSLSRFASTDICWQYLSTFLANRKLYCEGRNREMEYTAILIRCKARPAHRIDYLPSRYVDFRLPPRC
jgi:hypothetical protein